MSSREFDICWAPPWDPAICRRKLLDVQRTREKQRALRRTSSSGNPPPSLMGGRSLDAAIDELSPMRREQDPSPPFLRASRPSPTVDPLPFNRQGIPQTLSNSQGVQISPPSSIGTSLSYQNYANMPQSLLAASLDGRTMNNAPNSMYAGSASFSEYNTGVAVDQRLALSSMMLSGGGYNSYADGTMGQAMHGPQSFSSAHGDNVYQVPLDADFGYALQRPGVFPGMDLSMSGSSNIPPPQMMRAPYSPRQMPPEQHQRSRSFTHSNSGGSGAHSHNRRRSHGHNEVLPPGNQGLSQYMINQGMNSATSIKEDASDFVLGSGNNSMETKSSATSSLLAQQLEGRSAEARADSYQERMYASDSNIGMTSQPPAHLGAGLSVMPQQQGPPAMVATGMPYSQNVGMPASADAAGYYYTTYVTPSGAVMSAPVNMDMQSFAAMQMQHSYGSPYGNYADQQLPAGYGPPTSLHPQQQVYPPSNLSQPSFEEQIPPNQRQRATHPRYDYQGMSM
jgi:hypothetical protein